MSIVVVLQTPSGVFFACYSVYFVTRRHLLRKHPKCQIKALLLSRGLVMKRILLEALLNWKKQPSRKPLLTDGARQTGKTFLLKALFGSTFKRVLKVDFLESPSYTEVRSLVRSLVRSCTDRSCTDSH